MRVSVSPVFPTACICKGQIRDWSHQGQNSPLCSPPIHHSLICNIINELMCPADFINIHWHEIMKVFSGSWIGCSEKLPEAICKFCRSDGCLVLRHEHYVKHRVLFLGGWEVNWVRPKMHVVRKVSQTLFFFCCWCHCFSMVLIWMPIKSPIGESWQSSFCLIFIFWCEIHITFYVSQQQRQALVTYLTYLAHGVTTNAQTQDCIKWSVKYLYATVTETRLFHWVIKLIQALCLTIGLEVVE